MGCDLTQSQSRVSAEDSEITTKGAAWGNIARRVNGIIQYPQCAAMVVLLPDTSQLFHIHLLLCIPGQQCIIPKTL